MRVRVLLTTLATGLVALALFFSLPTFSGETPLSEREAFEKYLNEHPYNSRASMTREELKAIPKKDRPDLAMEQQFLLTMDPDTRTVPIERLLEANRIASALKRGGGGASATTEWVDRGPSNVGGRTRAVMFDPNDAESKKVWAGGVGGGMWYTDDITDPDGGWTNVNDFWANLAVSAIAYDPTNTDVFYAGTGEGWYNSDAIRGFGVFKTENAGETWDLLPSTAGAAFYHVQDVIVHPETGDVYVSTRDSGLRRSQDGGGTWEIVLGGPDGVGTNAADLELGADNRIYVSFGNVFVSGSAYASDSGDQGTWTKISENPGFPSSGVRRIELATAPADANRIYAVVQGTDSGVEGVYRSDDAGETWSETSYPGHAGDIFRPPGSDPSGGQAWYDLIIEVHPEDEDMVYLGTIDVQRSPDGGASWDLITSGYSSPGVPDMHPDQHNIVFRPGFANEAVFSHDGGVFYSPDVTLPVSSLELVNRNDGYNVTQYYKGALHPDAGSNTMLAGAQDNGTQRYFQPGFGFTSEANGGDGASTFIDQDSPAFAIASTQFIKYRLSTNGGITFSTVLLNVNGGSFINAAEYDDRENILYVNFGASSFYRVKGVTSAPDAVLVPAAFQGTATSLSASPFAPEGTSTLFVGTSSGRIFRISNAGADDLDEVVIEEIEVPWPGMAISSIEFGTSEDQILVTSSSYGSTSVWETFNGGVSWIDREGDLPDMPVRWGLYHPDAPGVAIVATEAGVWETTDLGDPEPSWRPSPSFPTVSTYMLQWRASDNTIMAATHGRGVFTATWDANVVSNEGDASAPEDNELMAAYPNPFVDRAAFSLRLADAQSVRVEVYDLRGRRVALLHDGPLSASEHRFEIDGSDLAAGTYLYVAAGETFRDEGRVTLVR